MNPLRMNPLDQPERPTGKLGAGSPFEPELDLIVACASADYASRITAIRPAPFHWDYVIRTATAHCVLPRLSQALGGAGATPAWMPPAARECLRRVFRRNAERNLYLAGELVRIVALLESEGIPCVPYKGPLLAMLVHGNLALRSFGDLDIILRRADIDRALQLLAARGFAPASDAQGTEHHSRLSRRKDYRLARPGDGLLVELHWAVSHDRFCVPGLNRLLWGDVTSVPFCGRTMLSPSPELLMIILCIHGGKHCWSRLGWLTDVACLTMRYELNWARIVSLARQFRCLRLLRLGVLLAADWLDARVPSSVLSGCRERCVADLARDVLGWIFQDPPPSPSSLEPFSIRVREDIRDRLLFAVHVLSPKLRPRVAHSSRGSLERFRTAQNLFKAVFNPK